MIYASERDIGVCSDGNCWMQILQELLFSSSCMYDVNNRMEGVIHTHSRSFTVSVIQQGLQLKANYFDQSLHSCVLYRTIEAKKQSQRGVVSCLELIFEATRVTIGFHPSPKLRYGGS